MRSLTDNRDANAFIDELAMTVAQLRDVPAAERSAVVAEEDQCERLLDPKGSQMCRRSVQSEDFGVGGGLANGWMHAASVQICRKGRCEPTGATVR